MPVMVPAQVEQQQQQRLVNLHVFDDVRRNLTMNHSRI
jgi:hypothetical protein